MTFSLKVSFYVTSIFYADLMNVIGKILQINRRSINYRFSHDTEIKVAPTTHCDNQRLDLRQRNPNQVSTLHIFLQKIKSNGNQELFLYDRKPPQAKSKLISKKEIENIFPSTAYRFSILLLIIFLIKFSFSFSFKSICFCSFSIFPSLCGFSMQILEKIIFYYV